MKLRKKIILVLSIIFITLSMYFFLTPKGSVRLAVIITGHPVRALTSNVTEDKFDEDFLKDYRFFSVIPTPEFITGPAGFWKTSQFGPFYWTLHAGMP